MIHNYDDDEAHEAHEAHEAWRLGLLVHSRLYYEECK